MLEVAEKINTTDEASLSLTLGFDLRKKSRQRARLDSGEDVALFLPRGTILRNNDMLMSRDGVLIRVQAALEKVSTASTSDSQLFARACYHLGNRHTELQIGEGWLRYQHDHVLDHLVQDLGLNIVVEDAPFEPEAGAFKHGH